MVRYRSEPEWIHEVEIDEPFPDLSQREIST